MKYVRDSVIGMLEFFLHYAIRSFFSYNVQKHYKFLLYGKVFTRFFKWGIFCKLVF